MCCPPSVRWTSSFDTFDPFSLSVHSMLLLLLFVSSYLLLCIQNVPLVHHNFTIFSIKKSLFFFFFRAIKWRYCWWWTDKSEALSRHVQHTSIIYQLNHIIKSNYRALIRRSHNIATCEREEKLKDWVMWYLILMFIFALMLSSWSGLRSHCLFSGIW